MLFYNKLAVLIALAGKRGTTDCWFKQAKYYLTLSVRPAPAMDCGVCAPVLFSGVT